jgi:tetratricopeptide (TPR) repeat protein/predicted Ser/Thr protein kinase
MITPSGLGGILKMACPSEQTILDFARRSLGADAAANVEAHIDGCPDCAELVADAVRMLSREASDGEETRDERNVSGAEPPPLTPAMKIGRYVILDRIGSGGMGVVYSAYDPELDRRIAVKLLRPDRSGGADRAQARLQREAQAIARLSHPNVIAVYDVGTFADRVFVAMELVDGADLREWVRTEPRSWHDVLEVMLAAGDGLAAAHRAGLVHRDFKPDNVLVARDGTVKVMDFGLARLDGDASSSDVGMPLPSLAPNAEADLRRASSSSLSNPLTLAGVTVGTPAYMAPEQHAGQADHRSDQFAFCVTLWESAFGCRPFAGNSADDVRATVLRGDVTPPPKDGDAPRWLAPMLRRGLSAAPADRHASMDALLRELRRRRGVTRRRRLAAAAIVFLTAATSFAYFHGQRERGPTCARVDERLSGVWDQSRGAAIRSAFSATELRYAAETWDRVEAGLTAYAERWAESRRDACEATHVRAEQSPELMDLRIDCLDHRLDELAAVTDIMVEADEEVVLHAVQTVQGLTPIARCDDIHALRAKVAPPDAAVRERVENVRRRLTRVSALELAGKHHEALASAERLVEEAEAIGYGPLEASARELRGKAEESTGEYERAEADLRAAMFAAEVAGDDAVAASAATALSWVLGVRLARFDEAHDVADYLEAKIARLDAPPDLRSHHDTNFGSVLWAEGDLEEAEARLVRAVEVREQMGHADDLALAGILNNLGTVQSHRGRFDAARTSLQRGLEIAERGLGGGHPLVADALANLGSLFYRQGLFDEAYAHTSRALAIFEQAMGPRSNEVAMALNNLGNILAARERFTEALRHHERALAIRIEQLGRDHRDVAQSLDNLGEALRGLGRVEEALQRHEESLAIKQRILPEGHADLAYSLHGIAECRRLGGEPLRAIDPLETALTLRRKVGEPGDLGQTAFLLAQVLWDANRDRVRALRLATEAQQAFARLDSTDGRDQAQTVERWLEARARGPGR